MTGCNVFILAVLVLGGVDLVTAQIPSVCANNANLTSGVCCPDNCGGSARGKCVHVSEMCKTDYGSVQTPPDDERFNWPSKIFTQVCQCKGNYGGFDCSECKFGYKGKDCDTKQTERVRTSITRDDFNWANYRNQLSRAKTEIQTRYRVYTGGDTRNETNYKPVSLYNLFAWMHHYVAWTAIEDYNETESAGDYAHESVGFLTWHRIYLLWFEREMQILLNNENFTVHYWDWTTPENQDILFTTKKLGQNDDVTGEVTGELMNTWYSVCVFQENGTANINEVCDPTSTPGDRRLRRCGENGHCNFKVWPDADNVRKSLNNFANYRSNTNGNSKIVNKYDLMSYSNYLEGFAVDDNAECGMIEDKETRNLLCGKNEDRWIRRRLHNLVHILLNGTIGSIPIAANDPVFINHHTMIDCLFEQWLTKNSNRQYPTTLDPMFAGHAAGDCMVPFLPVYNHSEVFYMSANDFGYSCDLRSFTEDSHNTEPCTKDHCAGPTENPTGTQGNGADSSLASATMLISVVVLCLVAVAI